MKVEQVELMGIVQYREMLGESMNIANLYRQGEFKFQTEDELLEQVKREYEDAKRRGKING